MPPGKRRPARRLKFAYCYSSLEYLLHFEREAALMGATVDELFRPRAGQLLRDLQRSIEHGFDLAGLFDCRNLDLDRLRQRHPYGHCRPRIKLQVSMTSKGNLSVRWAPLGWGFNGARDGHYVLQEDRRVDLVPAGASDWRTWYPSDRGWERPSNELLFLHEVDDLNSMFRSPGSYLSNEDLIAVEMLLIATKWRVSELVEALERGFDIAERDRIIVSFHGGDVPSTMHKTDEDQRRLLSWEIVDEDTWRQRLEDEQAAKERQELEGFEAAHGFQVEALVAAYVVAEARRKFANMIPNEQGRCKRAADALKAQGHAAAPGLVARTIALVRQWRPELLAGKEAVVEPQNSMVKRAALA